MRETAVELQDVKTSQQSNNLNNKTRRRTLGIFIKLLLLCNTAMLKPTGLVYGNW